MRSSVRAAFLATLALAVLQAPAAAQPRPTKPPMPDEIRPVVVGVAPPAMRVERARIARPGPEYIWTKGYWDWDGDSWAWVEGRWAAAPIRGARWIPARYVRVAEGWRYVPAHWSSQRVVGVVRGQR